MLFLHTSHDGIFEPVPPRKKHRVLGFQVLLFVFSRVLWTSRARVITAGFLKRGRTSSPSMESSEWPEACLIHNLWRLEDASLFGLWNCALVTTRDITWWWGIRWRLGCLFKKSEELKGTKSNRPLVNWEWLVFSGKWVGSCFPFTGLTTHNITHVKTNSNTSRLLRIRPCKIAKKQAESSTDGRFFLGEILPLIVSAVGSMSDSDVMYPSIRTKKGKGLPPSLPTATFLALNGQHPVRWRVPISRFHMSNKDNPGFLRGFLGDEILHSCMGIITQEWFLDPY